MQKLAELRLCSGSVRARQGGNALCVIGISCIDPKSAPDKKPLKPSNKKRPHTP